MEQLRNLATVNALEQKTGRGVMYYRTARESPRRWRDRSMVNIPSGSDYAIGRPGAFDLATSKRETK